MRHIVVTSSYSCLIGHSSPSPADAAASVTSKMPLLDP